MAKMASTTACTPTKGFTGLSILLILLGAWGIFTQHGEAFAFFIGALLLGITLYLHTVNMEDKENDVVRPALFAAEFVIFLIATFCFIASFGGI